MKLNIVNIAFNDIGIDPELGRSVVDSIQEYIKNHSSDAVSLQKIIEQTGLPGDEVKDVFFALLTLRYLKPTFLPRHGACESVIGVQERSIEEIRRKLDSEEYPSLCARCHEEIEDFEDIEIEIIFWKGRGGLFV